MSIVSQLVLIHHFQIFQLTKKTANIRKPQIINFVCYHNKCGQLNKNNCTSPLDCSHKVFTVPTYGRWVTTNFLRTAFCCNVDMPDIIHADGLLSLNFWQNRVLSFNLQMREGSRTGQDFAGFKCGIIKNHVRNYHAGIILPYSLVVINNMKALEPSQRGTVNITPSIH